MKRWLHSCKNILLTEGTTMPVHCPRREGGCGARDRNWTLFQPSTRDQLWFEQRHRKDAIAASHQLQALLNRAKKLGMWPYRTDDEPKIRHVSQLLHDYAARGGELGRA